MTRASFINFLNFIDFYQTNTTYYSHILSNNYIILTLLAENDTYIRFLLCHLNVTDNKICFLQPAFARIGFSVTFLPNFFLQNFHQFFVQTISQSLSLVKRQSSDNWGSAFGPLKSNSNRTESKKSKPKIQKNLKLKYY